MWEIYTVGWKKKLSETTFLQQQLFISLKKVIFFNIYNSNNDNNNNNNAIIIIITIIITIIIIIIIKIKQRVESELNVQNSQTDTEVDDVAVEEANNAIEETKVDEVDPSQNPSVIEDLAKEIRRARTQWENTSITERPLLPKITVNRKAELLIKQANQAIQLEIAEETPDLNNINLLQYVTAYLISEKLGKTPKPPREEAMPSYNQSGRQE